MKKHYLLVVFEGESRVTGMSNRSQLGLFAHLTQIIVEGRTIKSVVYMGEHDSELMDEQLSQIHTIPELVLSSAEVFTTDVPKLTITATQHGS